MTNTEKSLVAAGAISAGLVVLAVTALENFGHRQGPPTVAKQTAVTASPQTAVAPMAPPAPPTVQQAPSAAPVIAISPIPPLPANATSVPDEDLLKLAGMVDLAGARDHRPDKKRWEQAVSIAETLASGPCDCEQRNWLNHFVEMGGYALSDADQDYYQSAQLMATLGRNDKNAMDISRRPN